MWNILCFAAGHFMFKRKINLALARLSSNKEERSGVKGLSLSLSRFIPLQHGKLDNVPLLLTVITRGRNEKKSHTGTQCCSSYSYNRSR